MFNLSRYATLSSFVKNFGASRKIFASTSVLADKKDSVDNQKPEKEVKQIKNPTVAAVFATLNEPDQPNVSERINKNQKIHIDNVISKANTVNGLLSIADNRSDLNRKHALKIVSILAEWSTINRTKVSEFENDPRFTKLCRMLGRTLNIKNAVSANMNTNNNDRALNKISSFRTDDLNVVLGVTGDDEAAKLVASISLPQMVKVMKNLAIKKKRSTPLLHALANNISSCSQQLDIKQCADVLYSMSILNFLDTVLLTKLGNDIQENLKLPVERSSVIGSIISSLGFLKYRDTLVLDILCDWIVKTHEICRPQDITAMFFSLGLLNYMPPNMEESLKTKLVESLTPLDFKNPSDYLSYVWSLLALNISSEDLLSHVLQQDFIDKLTRSSVDRELHAAVKMKLLNINANVKFIPTYKGSMLSREKHKEIYNVPLVYNKEKQVIVNGMQDAIRSLVPEGLLTLNRDTNMGFVIDAEIYVNDKGTPVEKDTKDAKKVAIMMHDYKDACHGPHFHLNGITSLNARLLTLAGYHVLSVPYTEFSISDKVLKRVQYLEALIRSLNKN
ncbi:CLUMA_CG008410, isoform A [Clunio marinus]|uniref:CLUMA_CG008410, isoform A n=1 Tax=Clunio marinus TaxID=568069 RepID=A0A1J1I3K7_9DIPT|nr:CLUMA_CG008410, isoform A [Clunio marinus]